MSRFSLSSCAASHSASKRLSKLSIKSFPAKRAPPVRSFVKPVKKAFNIPFHASIILRSTYAVRQRRQVCNENAAISRMSKRLPRTANTHKGSQVMYLSMEFICGSIQLTHGVNFPQQKQASLCCLLPSVSVFVHLTNDKIWRTRQILQAGKSIRIPHLFTCAGLVPILRS